MTEIDWDDYRGWYDNGNKPRLAFYQRTSKVSGNYTNVITQEKNLLTLNKEIKGQAQYYLNGEFYFDDHCIFESDLNKSGKDINTGLQTFLNQLGYDDVVLVSCISRLTRMDVKSKAFKYLLEKIYAQNRSVYIYNGKLNPSCVDQKLFVHLAKISNEQFEQLNAISAIGNEKKKQQKQIRVKGTLEMLELGMSDKVIADTLGLCEKTVRNYKKELKIAGKWKRKGKSKLAKASSPEDMII
ncbi:MAG: hypothetical protein ACSHW0_06595 [Thalassotalea sp.]